MATFECAWNPDEARGPCISVLIQNPLDILDAGEPRDFGLPAPVPIMALIDTGAGISVVSKTFARTMKLRLTNEGSKIRTLGATLEGAEYAASVSFPGTDLRPLVPIRLFSADFIREPYYACLIGRDILQFWKVTFDGPRRKVSITD
jgi:hypothetical protein